MKNITGFLYCITGTQFIPDIPGYMVFLVLYIENLVLLVNCGDIYKGKYRYQDYRTSSPGFLFPVKGHKRKAFFFPCKETLGTRWMTTTRFVFATTSVTPLRSDQK